MAGASSGEQQASAAAENLRRAAEASDLTSTCPVAESAWRAELRNDDKTQDARSGDARGFPRAEESLTFEAPTANTAERWQQAETR